MGWKSTGGGTDADAIHDNVAAEISAIAEKAFPIAADLVVIEDSAAANAKKKVQLSNLALGQSSGIAYIDGFTEDNIAANLTDSQLYRVVQGTPTQIPVVATHDGSVIGLSVASSAARSAGTATFEVWKNGVGTGLVAVLNGADTQYVAASQAEGVDTFVAGDRLDVRVTTTGAWAPTTAEVEAVISVGSAPDTIVNWTSFTPTLVSDGVHPTVGNGVIAGLYRQVGDTVEAFCFLLWGATSTVGTGHWYFDSLPQTPNAAGYMGDSYVLDTGTRYFSGTSIIFNTATDQCGAVMADAAGDHRVAATVPIAWATGDQWVCQVTYRF